MGRDDELCYDSDPEEITRRRSRCAIGRANSLDTSTSLLHALNRGGSFADSVSPNRQLGVAAPRKLLDVYDDDYVKAQVQVCTRRS